MDMAVIQEWFPLTAPSIYTTIRNLEKKGYLTSETTQEGKLPPKTLYRLTEEGKKIFVCELLDGLNSYETITSDFGIALFHIGTLERADALSYVNKRIHLLTTLLDHARDRLKQCQTKVPFNMKMMLTCNLYRLETELKVTKELFDEITKSIGWNTSFVQYM